MVLKWGRRTHYLKFTEEHKAKLSASIKAAYLRQVEEERQNQKALEHQTKFKKSKGK